MTLRAAVYVRISDDRAGSGLGIKRQEADCRALAEQRGWDVEAVFSDNDVSAYSGKRRPGYEALLAALKDGQVHAVLAWHPDRLHRNLVELEAFIDAIEAADAEVATVSAGTFDLATPSGRFVARNLGAAARYESEHKAERNRRKHRELAEAGAAVGGGRPFGYEQDRTTVRSEEAALVREMAARVLAGETVRSVARDLVARGVTSPRGVPLHSKAIRRILVNRRMAGVRAYEGAEYPAVWPAILDDATSRRLRALLLDPERSRPYPARSWLLSGFLVCGRCGHRLVSQPSQRRNGSYCCSSSPERRGCGGVRIVARQLEEEVVGRVLAAVDAAEVARALAVADDGDEALLGALSDAEASAAQLARDYYEDRVIGRDEFLAARAGVQARVEEARRRLRDHDLRQQRTEWDASALEVAWPEMNLDQRRAVIAAYVEVVTIGPRVRPGVTAFDPARVSVTWRV